MSYLRIGVCGVAYEFAVDHSQRPFGPGFYIVLEDFSSGAAFRETDEGIDYPTLIADLLRGEYARVLRSN